jgi:ParB/RepB/Spo0J family partition protein
MKIENIKPTSKLGEGLNNLTNTMNNDFKEANKLQSIAQSKISHMSKLEKLRKFIGHVASIEVSEIEDDENIRQQLNTESEEFKTLLESIAKNGVQQNLIIDFQETNNEKGYQLKCIAGHRRLAVAKVLNLKSVPCLIKTFNNESDKLEIALAENLLREDLHCLDIADGYKKLSKCGWSREDIEKYFDRNQKTVRYYLKIGHWPNDAKNMIRNHPEKLSGRVIMRKYACRKFINDDEIIAALNKELNSTNNLKAENKRITLGSKVQSYLEGKRYSQEIKNIVWELFLDLQLVKAMPEKD